MFLFWELIELLAMEKENCVKDVWLLIFFFLLLSVEYS